MDYKVIQSFICKNSRTLFNEGSFYFCDDDKRVNELFNKGFIEKPVDKKTRTRKKVVDE